MGVEQQLKLFGSRARTPTQAIAPREVLDRFYLRVLGFAYQVLGDAELAAQASEQVFLRDDLPATELDVWKIAVVTIRTYLVRGFVVRPLVAPSSGWQSDLLRGLAGLAPMERALLLLRYHESLDPVALAEIFEVSETVMRHEISAARANLIERMGA
jgi:hypothetical protein